LKEKSDGKDKTTNAKFIKKWEALNGQIPGLLEMEAGIDFLHKERNGSIWHYVLTFFSFPADCMCNNKK